MSGQLTVAGLDFGGTKILGVLCDRAGVRAQRVVPAPASRDGDAMVAAAAGLIEALAAEANQPIAAAGVGTAGIVDQQSGVVQTAANIAGWAGYPLAAQLAKALRVPVVIENDVNAFLLGELRWGAVVGARDVLGLMIGTGVGGALALGGAIHQGEGGAAGEIGHTPGYGDLPCTCGRSGHLEALASGWAVATRYLGHTGRAANAEEVAGLARRGDAAAAQVYADAGTALAQAVTTVVDLLDIRQVVIGGGMCEAWDLLEPALTRQLAADPPVSGAAVRVVPSSAGAAAVALGATTLAWELYRPSSTNRTTAAARQAGDDPSGATHTGSSHSGG